jgi:membrane protease YdiL (CAAX protease family)
MIHHSPLKRGSAFRQILRMTTSWLVMTLSVILGAAGTVAAFFGAALFLNASLALFLVALSVGFLITFAGAWSAARMLRQARPGRIALGVGAATMLVLTLVASLTFLQPLPSTPAAHQPTPAPAGPLRLRRLLLRSNR